MTEITADNSAAAGGSKSGSLFQSGARTRKRHAAERRFRRMGLAAVIFGILALVGLMASILSNGLSSFQQAYITIDVFLDPAKLDKGGNLNPADLEKITTFTIQPLIQAGLRTTMEERGIAVEGVDASDAFDLISKEAPGELRRFILADPTRIGKTVSFDLLASGRIDGYYKDRVTMQSAALDSNVSPEQLMLADQLKAQGLAPADAAVTAFASPRRLAAHVTGVLPRAADKAVSQKLMPVSVGLDANGQPTPALLDSGMSRSHNASTPPVSAGRSCVCVSTGRCRKVLEKTEPPGPMTKTPPKTNQD